MGCQCAYRNFPCFMPRPTAHPRMPTRDIPTFGFIPPSQPHLFDGCCYLPGWVGWGGMPKCRDVPCGHPGGRGVAHPTLEFFAFASYAMELAIGDVARCV